LEAVLIAHGVHNNLLFEVQASATDMDFQRQMERINPHKIGPINMAGNETRLAPVTAGEIGRANTAISSNHCDIVPYMILPRQPIPNSNLPQAEEKHTKS
jgi:hypothetical protein